LFLFFQQFDKGINAAVLKEGSKKMHNFRSLFFELISRKCSGRFEYVRKNSKGKKQSYYFSVIQLKKRILFIAYKFQSIVSKKKESFSLQQQLKIKAF